MLLLWIRRIFSTRSAVYASANPLEKACIWLARMLEKKRLVCREVVSAHPILCISSGFSTAGLPVNRFLLTKQGLGRVAAPVRVHFHGHRASVVMPAWPHASHFMCFQRCRDRDRCCSQVQFCQDRQTCIRVIAAEKFFSKQLLTRPYPSSLPNAPS